MNLVYDVVGSGRPIVLLHGGFSHRRAFGYQLLGLSRTNRVVVPDLPGYHQSRWDPTVPWRDQAVAGVLQLVEDLHLESPVVIGWSLAGHIAAAVASTVPGARLVVVGSAADGVSDRTLATMQSRLESDFPRYARGVIRQFTSSGISLATEEWLFDMALATGAEVHAASLELAAVGLGTDLPDGALSIVGAHDQIVSTAAAAGADSGQLVFERSGHCPFIEESARFNEVLAELAAR